MRTPDFYVQLIESPTAAEEAVGITEATLISEYLRLAEIPVTIHRVRTRPEFSQAVAATFSARRPLVLHLSMHATKGGIELADGEKVSWNTLRPVLAKLNAEQDRTLLLCVSACFGIYGAAIADEHPEPFHALIGHDDEVSWNDAAVGFLNFYHRLAQGSPIEEAVQAMSASGDSRFRVRFAAEVRFDRFAEQMREVREAWEKKVAEVLES
jgi:hypothetical protein